MEFWQNVVLVLTVSSVNIMGWPLGAPEQACNTITPNHISTANTATGEAPFSVNINDIGSSYNPGEMYTIVLSAGEDLDFRGFLIQGRTMADGTPVGTFVIDDDTNQRVACMGDTAATHVNNTQKDEVILMWRAPSNGTGTILFRYAFVYTYRPNETPQVNMYWANLETDTVNEQGTGGGSTGLVAGSMLILLLSTIITLIN